LVTVYAVRQGAKPERTAAAILIGIQVIDRLYHAISGEPGIYHNVDVAHAAIDIVALSGILWLALISDRFWTLWLGALQLIATLAHLIRLLEVEMYPIVYAIIIQGPFWGQMIVVVLGTWLYARRQRQAAGPNISRQS
jgi:hypothetical protein